MYFLELSGGTGTYIMELTLAQELESIGEDPLFLVFLDSWMYHDNLDRGLLLHTLEGCRSEPKMSGIMM